MRDKLIACMAILLLAISWCSDLGNGDAALPDRGEQSDQSTPIGQDGEQDSTSDESAYLPGAASSDETDEDGKLCVVITGDQEPDVVIIEDGGLDVMRGQHGAALVFDSVSDDEYYGMMDILYPDSRHESQRLSISGIDNTEDARAQHMAWWLKAYSVEDGEGMDIDVTPFTVSLDTVSSGKTDILFYSARVGDDAFVFPSEWGNQPCGFIYNSECGVYLAKTDYGIWRIDPYTCEAKLLTSTTYDGKTAAELCDEDPYCTWIDSVQISPDGTWILFRSSRDAPNTDETSIWKINVAEGTETRLLPPDLGNIMVGFLDEGTFVVGGSLDDTREVDVEDGKTVPLTIPERPNLNVAAAQDGKLVIYSRDDECTTVSVYAVDGETGELTELVSASGVLKYDPDFSPDGNKIAIEYGTDPEKGKDDVLILDLAAGTGTLLSEQLTTYGGQDSQQSATRVHDAAWLDNNTLVVTVSTSGD